MSEQSGHRIDEDKWCRHTRSRSGLRPTHVQEQRAQKYPAANTGKPRQITDGSAGQDRAPKRERADLALDCSSRRAEHPHSCVQKNDADENLVPSTRQCCRSPSECRRNRHDREWPEESPGEQSSAIKLERCYCCDQNVECQRRRLHHARRETEQTHHRQIARRPTVPDGRVEGGANEK